LNTCRRWFILEPSATIVPRSPPMPSRPRRPPGDHDDPRSRLAAVRKRDRARLAFALVLALAAGHGAQGAGEGTEGREERHWAFLPIRPTPPPPIQDRGWGTGPIDAFVLRRLGNAGLNPIGIKLRRNWP
jgi:hypothetical protein